MEIHSRATGRFVGRVLVLGSIGAVVMTALRSDRIDKRPNKVSIYAVIALGVVGGFGAGIHLLNKIYDRDPAALAEYRREIDSQPLASSLRRFSGVAGMLRVIGIEDLRERFVREVTHHDPDGRMSLCTIVTIFDASVVGDLITTQLFSAKQLRSYFDADIAAAASFSDLWVRAKYSLPYLAEKQLVDLPMCRGLFISEFDWIDAQGNVQASAPCMDDVDENAHKPAASRAPGASLGLFQAVALYGDFVIKHFGVTAAWLAKALETSSDGTTKSLSQLNSFKMCLDLFKRGFLTQAFVSKKFVDEFGAASEATIWDVDNALGGTLVALTDAGAIAEHLLAPIVLRSLPLDDDADSIARIDDATFNIVTFLRVWSRFLCAHPLAVPQEVVVPLTRAKADYDRATARYNEEINKSYDLVTRAAEYRAYYKVQREATQAYPLSEKEFMLRERECKLDEERAAMIEKDAKLTYRRAMEQIQIEFARSSSRALSDAGITVSNSAGSGRRRRVTGSAKLAFEIRGAETDELREKFETVKRLVGNMGFI